MYWQKRTRIHARTPVGLISQPPPPQRGPKIRSKAQASQKHGRSAQRKSWRRFLQLCLLLTFVWLSLSLPSPMSLLLL